MLKFDLFECWFHGVIIPSVKEKSRVFQGFWLQAKPFYYCRKHVSFNTVGLIDDNSPDELIVEVLIEEDIADLWY